MRAGGHQGGKVDTCGLPRAERATPIAGIFYANFKMTLELGGALRQQNNMRSLQLGGAHMLNVRVPGGGQTCRTAAIDLTAVTMEITLFS